MCRLECDNPILSGVFTVVYYYSMIHISLHLICVQYRAQFKPVSTSVCRFLLNSTSISVSVLPDIVYIRTTCPLPPVPVLLSIVLCKHLIHILVKRQLELIFYYHQL